MGGLDQLCKQLLDAGVEIADPEKLSGIVAKTVGDVGYQVDCLGRGLQVRGLVRRSRYR